MGRLADWRRVARTHPAVADALLAAVLFVVSLLSVNPPGGPPRDPLTVGAVLLALVGCAALAVRRRYPLPLPVLGAAVVAALGVPWFDPAVVVLLLWFGVAVAVGDAVRSRRAYVAVLAEWSRRAEQTREEEAPRRVAEETDAPTEPAPSLNRLDALVEDFSAGQPVRWTVAGQPRPLPTAVDVAAYRIIQESLTNAHKHAPGAAVAVRLRYDADGVTIEVRDDGPPRPEADATTGPARARGDATAPDRAGILAPDASGTGLGLLGIRERAETVGGAFSAGPRPDGGWLVRAELPAPEEEAG